MFDLTSATLPWLSLAFLGAVHGVNPGMGWLFAVALGLQERRRSAVLRALGPIALGHAISIGAVAAAVALPHQWAEPSVLKTLAAGSLIAFGVYKLLAPLSHPRWVGMRVTGRDLAVWSFLMATAHGAGLMLVPFLLRLPGVEAARVAHATTEPGTRERAVQAAHAGHAEFASAFETVRLGAAGLSVPGELMAVAVHSAAMLLVMAVVAILVFDRLGLAILRRAWINVDRLWAGSLVGMGALTLLV